MNIEDVTTCTVCGNEIDDIKTRVIMRVESSRKKSTGVWEKIQNLDLGTNEILCLDCFNKFHESLSLMNKTESSGEQ